MNKMLDEKIINEMPFSFSPQALSKLLGVLKSFMYNVINSGDLKHYEIGKRKIVLKDDFITWLGSREKRG
jgi:hypothetical protein